MKKENINNITESGFKTPDHYFDSFEAQLLKRMDNEIIIGTIESPGFTVPKNYFDTIENNILETLEPKMEKPVIQFKPRSTFYYFAGIAASFVLLFSLVFNNKALTFNTIDTVSIENYLYQEDYSTEEIATLFKFDEISELDFIDVTISDATINDYLENIDTEDFILD